MYRRETPHYDVPPEEIREEIRAILKQCKLYPFVSGTGFVITDDPELASRLRQGWEWVDGEETQRFLRCSASSVTDHSKDGSFKMASDADKVWYEFRTPTAMTVIAREILDAR